MTCRYSDQSLLLFIHGDLSLFSRWMLQAHLRSCAHCRERQALLSRTSLAIARAIREPSGGAWTFAAKQPGRAMAASRRATIMAAALIAVILITAAIVATTVSSGRRTPAMQAPYPCRPGIPSDAC